MDVLLNWLMQGVLVAIVAAIGLSVIPRSRPQARYYFIWAACIVVSALPAMPLVFAATAISVAPADQTVVRLEPMVSMPTAWWTSTPLAVVLWTVWSAIYAIRVGVDARQLCETRRHCRECPPTVQARLHCWSRVRVTGRRTRVVLSTGVRSAAVISCGSPLIALAPSLIERLSDDDVDRVVIHEWAHVQRRDDIAQGIQRLTLMVAGWHPAVWWLQRQLDLEREVACDEIAVVVTGSAKRYAACLATIASLPRPPIRPPALAITASSGLRCRIVRVLSVQRGADARPWRATAISASVTLAAMALILGNVRVIESAAVALSMPAVPRPAAASTTSLPPAVTFGSAVEATPSVIPVTSPRSRSDEAARSSKRDLDVSGTRAVAAAAIEPPPMAASEVPLPLLAPPIDRAPASLAVATLTTDVAIGPSTSQLLTDRSDTQSRVDDKGRAPWAAAADAGVALGRSSRNAGVATAGFFSRVAKKIAGSF